MVTHLKNNKHGVGYLSFKFFLISTELFKVEIVHFGKGEDEMSDIGKTQE